MSTSGTLELIQLVATKKQLNSVPEEEILFILAIADLLQEITALQKLASISSKAALATVERQAEDHQALYFVRMVAAAVYEGWLTIQKHSALYREYVPNLEPPGKSAFDRLKRYFGTKDTLIERVRNRFAYHHDRDPVAALWKKLPDTMRLEFIFSENHGNCHFAASHQVLTMAILEVTEISDVKSVLDRLFEETLTRARDLMDLLIECIWIFVKKLPDKEEKPITLYNVPYLQHLRLHYYTLPPDSGTGFRVSGDASRRDRLR